MFRSVCQSTQMGKSYASEILVSQHQGGDSFTHMRIHTQRLENGMLIDHGTIKRGAILTFCRDTNRTGDECVE